MTNKEKIKAYRKAAELIREGKFYYVGMALDAVEMPIPRIEVMVLLDGILPPNCYTIEFRETILLSCAELVRLDFEIE